MCTNHRMHRPCVRPHHRFHHVGARVPVPRSWRLAMRQPARSLVQGGPSIFHAGPAHRSSRTMRCSSRRTQGRRRLPPDRQHLRGCWSSWWRGCCRRGCRRTLPIELSPAARDSQLHPLVPRYMAGRPCPMAAGKENWLMAPLRAHSVAPITPCFVTSPAMTTVVSWPAASRTPASARRECQ